MVISRLKIIVHLGIIAVLGGVNKVLWSGFLVSFVSLIQYQTDLFTRSPLTKDCSTRIYSESMSVYGGQCILLITSKNFIGPLNLNLKKSRVWFTILCI